MPPVQLKTKLKAYLTTKPDHRVRTLLAGLMILAVLFIYYNQLYTSRARVVEALAAEYEHKEALLHEYLARGYDDIAYLEEQEKNVRLQIENLHALVPGHLDEPGVLVDLYRLVRYNNLRAEEIIFDKYREENGFGRLPVELTVEGETAGIYRLIGQLENFHRLVRVASVEFDPAGGGRTACRLRAEFYVLGAPGDEPGEHYFVPDKSVSKPVYSILQPPPGNDYNAGGSTGAGKFTGNAGESTGNAGVFTGGTGDGSGAAVPAGNGHDDNDSDDAGVLAGDGDTTTGNNPGNNSSGPVPPFTK